MTARKLNASITKAAATPTAPMVRPATAGPMIRAPLNIAELSATALPTSSRPDHLHRERLADRHVERVGGADREGDDDEQRDRFDCAMAITAKAIESDILTSCVTSRVRRLGSASARTPANRPNRRIGQELRGRDHPEPEDVAGELQDEPRLGDLLHPRPDEADGLATEEEPVVAMTEGADPAALGQSDAATTGHGQRAVTVGLVAVANSERSEDAIRRHQR